MAKNHEWKGSTLHYTVPGAGAASLDIDSLSDDVKKFALMFGIQTAARNSTAGLFKEDPAAALKRMTGRFTSWMAGEWKAASAGGDGAERGSSMLARAIAEAGGITAEEAAELVTEAIESKVTEAGLSADEEDDKAAIRKIGGAVRSYFGEMTEVAPILARLKVEAAQARAAQQAADAEKAKAEGKTGASLSDLLKK